MAIVSDSGPILSFARAGRLELLPGLLQKLIIPQAVWDDLVVRGSGKPNAGVIAEAPWIERYVVRDRNLVHSLPGRLHVGEREAIALARGLGTVLLVDEREARKEARRLGVVHFGSLRVLKEAKDRGLLSTVRPALDDLVRSGTYIGATLYHDFLRQVGEEP